ncbi:hypothetical protein CTI12_AA413050 [Artemisia annua]|uniref:Uncharacterized protein n=1 Tax=Artemisia annua TaxID=35608 RepID=A0A2U1M7B0_ARTAN|nr:hypothetical protein CTI12_AA413050 [Artemisia annua]
MAEVIDISSSDEDEKMVILNDVKYPVTKDDLKNFLPIEITIIPQAILTSTSRAPKATTSSRGRGRKGKASTSKTVGTLVLRAPVVKCSLFLACRIIIIESDTSIESDLNTETYDTSSSDELIALKASSPMCSWYFSSNTYDTNTVDHTSLDLDDTSSDDQFFVPT